MEAIYWGSNPVWGRGLGSGPWVMADLENGLWGGNEALNPGNVPLTYPFVTAMVKGGTNGFALKAGDATQGKLQSMFDGPRPPGYQPMRKQGAIILGIGEPPPLPRTLTNSAPSCAAQRPIPTLSPPLPPLSTKAATTQIGRSARFMRG